ncbi:unnamed protein product [Symbiodinium sp. CCMP2592]|nr:unnamed protein product [Symbiodinium sp. CCMP2592]CAE7554510.1 unnamed protein product [Symbiodinium sp. CCMP2592]
MLQIADLIQSGLTTYCQQVSRFSGKVVPSELQLGWLVNNRWARVMVPDGYSSHCGFANVIILTLIHVCNSCVARMTIGSDDEIPTFTLDLSFLILDRVMECHWALKQIFATSVAITLYRARQYKQVDELVDWFVCLALPSSSVEQLASGQTATIPTPLGQLNPQFTIEASLRKLAHWYRQSRFSRGQIDELVKILVFRRTREMADTRLKTETGIGGFKKFHNCSFLGCSWCMTIDSSYATGGEYKYCLPAVCRQHCVILELTSLTVEKACALIHNSSYSNWMPTEALHRHCSFPLSSMQIEGIPELSLLTENCEEVPADDIAAEADLLGDSSSSAGSLTQQEYSVMLATAATIAKKRKGQQ